MATSVSAIQALYVAYFNRPADYFGLPHWQAIADSKGLAYVANEFSKSPEYTAQYAGKSPADAVDQIYVNLFGRHAEAAGLVHWVNLLSSGVNNMGDIALAISQGAQNEDLVAVNAKVDAAATFTTSLAGNAAAIRGYDGAAANAVAVAWLTQITNTATHDAAISAASLAALTANVVQAHDVGSVNSTTFLGAGVDTLAGTVGNDVFNALTVDTSGAAADTLSAFDTIDGGAGVDTLNIYSDGKNASLPGSATVKNVENINIFNGTTTFNTGTALTLDASKFVGATNITQIGNAAAVTNLAATTTASFKDVAAASALSVTAAAAAATATVSLNGVDDSSSLAVLGGATGKLGTVTIIGAVKDGADAGTAVNRINVNFTVGKDVQTAVVNSTVGINLDVNNGAGTKAVTTVNAGGSTGAINYNADSTVSSITTGTGKDIVSLNTAFSTTVTTASVSTGAGDDVINVAVTGTGTISVNAGAGDDTINLVPVTLVAGDKIDGGEGVDTLQLNNSAALVAGDYVLFDATISNVEKLEFANAVTTADGSKLAQFSTLIFDDTAVITKASQELVTHGATLDATAVGYSVASGTGVITYAGALKVTADTDATALTLKGDSAVVTVATDGADTGITIDGQLKSKLTVDLVNDTDAAGTVDYLTSATITLDATVNKALASIVLTGDGSVVIDATAAVALTTVDASGLGGKLVDGAITGGLTFTGNVANAETIILGSGTDVITLTGSTYDKLDTITGFDAVKETDDVDSVVDSLVFGGLTIDGTTAAAITKVTLNAADTSLALAFVRAATASHAAADGVVQFQFGGNTYLFQQANADAALDGTDFAVKLTGLVDLTTEFATHA